MNIKEYPRSILPANQALVANAYKTLHPENPKSREDKSKILKEVCASFGPKLVGYDKLRTEIYDLYVRANGFWFDFFDYKTYSGAEVPKYYVKSVKPKIPIRVVSNLGGYNVISWADGMTPVIFDWQMYQSDIVKYAKLDLIQGSVERSDAINEAIQESIEDKLDATAEIAINGCFGAFDDTVFILDSRIKNPPTTNDFDLSNICNGRVTVDLFKAILQHADRLQSPVRMVYLPAARRSDMLDWVSLTDPNTMASQTIPEAMREEIWRSGNFNSVLMPPVSYTNRLDGETAGSIYVYVVFDGPIGTFCQKPEMHHTMTKEDWLYWETGTMFTGVFVCPAYNRKNIARFKIG